MHGTILIVEDDVDTAELVRDGLRKRGFDGTIVRSGEDCLARLHADASTIDVVVTDIGMPGMSGIELCAQLKERYPQILAVVLTGSTSLETAIAAMRAGAYDYVPKPVKLDVLE